MERGQGGRGRARERRSGGTLLPVEDLPERRRSTGRVGGSVVARAESRPARRGRGAGAAGPGVSRGRHPAAHRAGDPVAARRPEGRVHDAAGAGCARAARAADLGPRAAHHPVACRGSQRRFDALPGRRARRGRERVDQGGRGPRRPDLHLGHRHLPRWPLPPACHRLRRGREPAGRGRYRRGTERPDHDRQHAAGRDRVRGSRRAGRGAGRGPGRGRRERAQPHRGGGRRRRLAGRDARRRLRRPAHALVPRPPAGLEARRTHRGAAGGGRRRDRAPGRPATAGQSSSWRWAPRCWR